MSLLGSTCWIGGSVIFSVSSIAPFSPKIRSDLIYIFLFWFTFYRDVCEANYNLSKLNFEAWFIKELTCTVGFICHHSIIFNPFYVLVWYCTCAFLNFARYFGGRVDVVRSLQRISICNWVLQEVTNIWTFICHSSLELVTYRAFYCFINCSLYTWWLWLGTSHTDFVKHFWTSRDT
jgi:hypothetical protein